VVNSVNPASIIDFLFRQEIIRPVDMIALLKLPDDPQQQSIKLLALLHKSEQPQAFMQLYLAIKEEPHLKWLIDRIDDLNVQALIAQRYINEPSGE